MMKKIVFIFIVMFLGGSYFAEAYRELHEFEFFSKDGVLYIARYYMDYDDNWHPPMLYEAEPSCIHISEAFNVLDQGYYIPRGCGKFSWNQALVKTTNMQYDFNLVFNEVLYLTASDDAVVSVYDFVSSKNVANGSIVKDSQIILHNIQCNTYYLLTLKTKEEVQKHQIFFINNNQLFTGAQYEK